MTMYLLVILYLFVITEMFPYFVFRLVCRYQYGVKLVNEKKFKKVLQAKIMMEGTELDKTIAKDSKEV